MYILETTSKLTYYHSGSIQKPFLTTLIPYAKEFNIKLEAETERKELNSIFPKRNYIIKFLNK